MTHFSPGSICETRKGPNNPPPTLFEGGIEYFVCTHLARFGQLSKCMTWPCIRAYKQVSMTSRSKELNSFAKFPVVNRAKTTKRYIYKPRPFNWAYNQLSMTFLSKCLTRKVHVSKNRCFRPFLQSNLHFFQAN